MKFSNRMNRISTVLIVLVAAGFATGCADYMLKQVAVSAHEDLNTIMTDHWLAETVNTGGSRGSIETEYTNVSYLVSDVHYSMASPAGSPETVRDTTAVAINSGGNSETFKIRSFSPNALKVLEFGAANTPTSTENNNFSGVGEGSWAIHLSKKSNGNLRLSERTFATIKEASNDSILGWGRWTDSRFISAGVVVPGCCSENKSAHYVFGAATPNANIPASGTATFNLIAATAPTLISGTNAPGTLSSASQVGVSWGGATTDTKIGISLLGSFTAPGPVAVPFSVTTAGGAANPLNGGLAYDAATRSFGGIITGGSVSGFIAGPQATHVGLTYDATIASPQITGIAQGAAALKR